MFEDALTPVLSRREREPERFENMPPEKFAS